MSIWRVAAALGMLAVGRDAELRAMPTVWIHGGVIPPCPSCGALTRDQVRAPNGGSRLLWRCLICELHRQPDPDWVDELVPISDVDLAARNRAMSARVRARWRAAAPSSASIS